jgi:hypothetical protein
MIDFENTVQEQRKTRYRQTTPVRTAHEALVFVNEVGFCLFCRHARLELPNLRDATAGSSDIKSHLPLWPAASWETSPTTRRIF